MGYPVPESEQQWTIYLETSVLNQETEIHPSLLLRKIIHIDMDAFYASVEMRDNPELRGRPVVIGGSPKSRGVVCTASYEARKFGIRSAIPCSKAYRLCPQAIFIAPDFAKYKAVSNEILKIFYRYTPLVEPLSLDEAFLDVTQNSNLFAVQIGKDIRQAIKSELDLSCSVGVAPNKLVAKIASDYRKPGGLTAIPPDKVFAFMNHLPVRRLFGVGPATELRLAQHGIRTCADLVQLPLVEIERTFGQQGVWLHQAAQGIDLRPVQLHRIRKSFGREETFPQDETCLSRLLQELHKLCMQVVEDLNRSKRQCRTLTLKVKYSDFSLITRSWTNTSTYADFAEIYETAKQLLLEKSDAGRRPVRLIGVSAANLTEAQEDSSATESAARLNGNTNLLEAHAIDRRKSLF